MDADANADADAGGSAIALPGLHPGELIKMLFKAEYHISTHFFVQKATKYYIYLKPSIEKLFNHLIFLK